MNIVGGDSSDGFVGRVAHSVEGEGGLSGHDPHVSLRGLEAPGHGRVHVRAEVDPKNATSLHLHTTKQGHHVKYYRQRGEEYRLRTGLTVDDLTSSARCVVPPNPVI